MKNILIVAAREFKHIASMRSFWLTLLILPMALAFGPIAQRYLRDDDPDRVMIVDRSGGTIAKALEQRISADEDRRTLQKLSRYVQRHKLERADPAAPWAMHDRWYSQADIAQFRAAGGVEAALASIARVKQDDTPEFEPPADRFAVVAPPAALSGADDGGFGEAAQSQFKTEGKKDAAADYVLLVPADFGRSPTVRLWARSEVKPEFAAAVQDVLTRGLRTRFLEANGVATDAAEAASAIVPALAVTTPPPGGGAREAMLVRSILPLAACYLLMMSLMLSGSWMLQGTVEERSNKLLETVLACVSPEELMYGKLLGTVAVGLSMIATWVGCGIVAAYATHGAIADLIRPALEPVSDPGTLLTLIYFFVVGYILHSVLFLAIGGMSESMREAQGYMMPMLLAIILPITFLMQAIIAASDNSFVTILTWVPIWAPFAVLARLGAGIPTWEVIGSGLVLGAFTIVSLVMVARLFRASLLAQGQRPGLGEVIARIRKGAATPA